ncbi:MAG: hypothetical protein HY703_02095 [Gemmatimonadetes bacterium]|nr:hypothetical protein [Gemmatimonadota bacterium]
MASGLHAVFFALELFTAAGLLVALLFPHGSAAAHAYREERHAARG